MYILCVCLFMYRPIYEIGMLPGYMCGSYYTSLLHYSIATLIIEGWASCYTHSGFHSCLATSVSGYLIYTKQYWCWPTINPPKEKGEGKTGTKRIGTCDGIKAHHILQVNFYKSHASRNTCTSASAAYVIKSGGATCIVSLRI